MANLEWLRADWAGAGALHASTRHPVEQKRGCCRQTTAGQPNKQARTLPRSGPIFPNQIDRPWPRQGSALGAVGGCVTGGPFMCAPANYPCINSLSRGVPSILVLSHNDECGAAAPAGPAILAFAREAEQQKTGTAGKPFHGGNLLELLVGANTGACSQVVRGLCKGCRRALSGVDVAGRTPVMQY